MRAGPDLPRLPSPRRPRLPRSGPRRRARRPARRADHEEPSMSTDIGNRRPDVHPARHRRRRALAGRCPRDARRLHLQPLPLRAGLARPHPRGGAGLPRREGPRRQLQRRRALPARLVRGDARARRRRRRLAAALPLRREPGGRPRVRRQDDARLLPRSTPRAGSSTAAHPTPTTRTRRSTPRGCAARSTRCWPARCPTRPRPSRWAARSSGGSDHAGDDARRARRHHDGQQQRLVAPGVDPREGALSDGVAGDHAHERGGERAPVDLDVGGWPAPGPGRRRR